MLVFFVQNAVVGRVRTGTDHLHNSDVFETAMLQQLTVDFSIRRSIYILYCCCKAKNDPFRCIQFY